MSGTRKTGPRPARTISITLRIRRTSWNAMKPGIQCAWDAVKARFQRVRGTASARREGLVRGWRAGARGRARARDGAGRLAGLEPGPFGMKGFLIPNDAGGCPCWMC